MRPFAHPLGTLCSMFATLPAPLLTHVARLAYCDYDAPSVAAWTRSCRAVRGAVDPLEYKRVEADALNALHDRMDRRARVDRANTIAHGIRCPVDTKWTAPTLRVEATLFSTACELVVCVLDDRVKRRFTRALRTALVAVRDDSGAFDDKRWAMERALTSNDRRRGIQLRAGFRDQTLLEDGRVARTLFVSLRLCWLATDGPSDTACSVVAGSRFFAIASACLLRAATTTYGEYVRHLLALVRAYKRLASPTLDTHSLAIVNVDDDGE